MNPKKLKSYAPARTYTMWPKVTTPAELLDSVKGWRWRAAHHSRKNLSGALRSRFLA
ncbi:MAG: hypothetical protein GF388_07460 [Candidatus Aegiribacteria sp.]|nr:hypothetical protein [Candidatus Aegiribacteria sp.]MBD3294964.1 hypothetical protein [Candidatus Fermentibacteria bacterium]